MKPILFNIGPLAIHSWGILVTAGIIAGFLLARKRANSIDLSAERLTDLALFLVIGGIVGGRLLYVVINAGKFIADPLDVFAVWQGGMSIHGAIIGGVAAGLIFTRRYRLSFLKVADLVAPSIILGQAIGRIGCFLNGDSYGVKSVLSWAVKFPGLDGYRHPTQLYEAALDLVAFFIIWRRRDRTLFKGELILTYAIAYSVVRGIVEVFRESPRVLGPISPAQIASLVVMVAAGALIAIGRRRAKGESGDSSGRTRFHA